jgi:hypothetical protein
MKMPLFMRNAAEAEAGISGLCDQERLISITVFVLCNFAKYDAVVFSPIFGSASWKKFPSSLLFRISDFEAITLPFTNGILPKQASIKMFFDFSNSFDVTNFCDAANIYAEFDISAKSQEFIMTSSSFIMFLSSKQETKSTLLLPFLM